MTMLFRQLTMFVFFLAMLSIGQADVRGGGSRRLDEDLGPCICVAGTVLVPTNVDGACGVVDGLDYGNGPEGQEVACPGTAVFNDDCCVPDKKKKMMMMMMSKRK